MNLLLVALRKAGGKEAGGGGPCDGPVDHTGLSGGRPGF